MSDTIAKLTDFVGFQAGWWSCILGAAAGRGEIGVVVVTAALAIRLALASNRRGELALVLFAILLGLMLDGSLAANDLLRFDTPPEDRIGTLPPWMLALWANFAPTLGASMSWLRRRWLLGALFGLVGGPTTYFAGTQLGALQFAPEPWQSWVALALTWTLAMVLMLVATERCLPGPGGAPSRATAARDAVDEG